MKQHRFLFLVIFAVPFFLSSPAGAVEGWVWENPMSDGKALYGVWGDPETDNVFVVGEDGVILHHDGCLWTRMASGVTDVLVDVWGSSPEDVFVVGFNGVILHYDGVSWSGMIRGTAD